MVPLIKISFYDILITHAQKGFAVLFFIMEINIINNLNVHINHTSKNYCRIISSINNQAGLPEPGFPSGIKVVLCAIILMYCDVWLPKLSLS